MKHKKNNGFGLIDITVAVGVVGIMAGTAYPGLTDYYRDLHRTDAKIALQGLAMKLERLFAINGSYKVGGEIPQLGCTDCIFPGQAPLDGANKTYTLAISEMTDQTFLLRATPIESSGQNEDPCGTLTLSSTGLKGAAKDNSQCWDR